MKLKAILILPLFLHVVACTDATGNKSKDLVKISVTASANPLLIGVQTNPVLQVAIYVPSNISRMNYKSIHCTLNEGSLADIQKIEVYFPDSTPGFSTNNFSTSMAPSSDSFDLPVDLNLASGVHYLWLSITLKKEADIDHSVDLHVTQLIGSLGQ